MQIGRVNEIGMTDAYPPEDLTAFQRDLLAVIAQFEEPHGLKIKDSLEADYGKEIHHGRLYPNLDTLVDKGLVTKGKIDRRTNSYSLSERGRRELESYMDWLSEQTAEKVTA